MACRKVFFGNCNFYSLLKVLVTRRCNVAFASVACIIRCWFLVNHLAVQATKLVFVGSTSVRGFRQYYIFGTLASEIILLDDQHLS